MSGITNYKAKISSASIKIASNFNKSNGMSAILSVYELETIKDRL